MDLLLLLGTPRYQVRKYTRHAVQSSLYRGRQGMRMEVWTRSTLSPHKTWPARPLPNTSSSGHICLRQPLRCRVPALRDTISADEKETRMTALDQVAMNGSAPFTPPQTADEAREYIRANGI